MKINKSGDMIKFAECTILIKENKIVFCINLKKKKPSGKVGRRLPTTSGKDSTVNGTVVGRC